MSCPGRLIEKLFKNKCIDIFISNFGEERLELSQFSIANKMIIHGKVIQYHEDCGILELENHIGQNFYINDENIDMFFEAGIKIIESIGTIILTGKKLKKQIEE